MANNNGHSQGAPEGLRVGVYICSCGSNIGGVINPGEVAEFASHLPDVVLSRDNLYMCGDPGQSMVRKDIVQFKLNRVVIAACSVRMHEPTFRACVASAGLNPFLMEMTNIREQDTWVHGHDPEGALLKAKEMVAAAVAKVRYAMPLQTITVPVTKRAMVIGGGVAGISAALDLGDMGIPTYLVEKELSIGGTMAQLNKTFPTMDCSI
jgi:heterodisulfide reductase subunit A